MTRLRLMPMLAVALIALLGGCATRPINPPITQADPSAGYRYEARQRVAAQVEKLLDAWRDAP